MNLLESFLEASAAFVTRIRAQAVGRRQPNNN